LKQRVLERTITIVLRLAQKGVTRVKDFLRKGINKRSERWG
jgi:hypothetical protein